MGVDRRIQLVVPRQKRACQPGNQQETCHHQADVTVNEYEMSTNVHVGQDNGSECSNRNASPGAPRVWRRPPGNSDHQ